MPLINKQPFKPNPIPDNLGPDDGVFYYDLTNEIFTDHDAFLDRFLYCNSLIWTCSRTGKSGLTYKEALDSEQTQGTAKKKKRGKRSAPDELSGDLAEAAANSTSSTSPNKTQTSSEINSNGEGSDEPAKKKKKKYPYDPKKYSMPVPEGFDPSLLTPTGKIDGRKLKSKKNRLLAEELLSTSLQDKPSSPGKKGRKSKIREDETRKKEEEVKKKENDAKKKAQMQAELAKEREFEAKRKKEAAALARQLERQKKEEEKKKATAFLTNWEKKCEDLERDDLRRLPQPTPVICDIPERLFGDSIFIMEAIYNFHDLYEFNEIYPDGNMSFDTLEEILMEKQDESAFGTLLQFLLKTIFFTQPTKDGYGLDDDSTIQKPQQSGQDDEAAILKQEPEKSIKSENFDGDLDYEANGIGSEADEDENGEKYVNMNDRIGFAIKAAQEVKKSFSKPLPEMEITPQNVTEILRLHLLQSGSFPKGRTIYNGWYSSREDPGLWLCMQEPDLIKKLGEGTIYDLEIEDRIKILHTLIYQLFTFIKSRLYMELASDQLVELRKTYRKEAADFARWDRENCVKRMQPPKRKTDSAGANTEKTNSTNNDHHNEQNIKSDYNDHNGGTNLGDEADEDKLTFHHQNHDPNNTDDNNQLKSCLKANGTSDQIGADNDDAGQSKKKITFRTGGLNGAMEQNGGHGDECDDDHHATDNHLKNNDSHQNGDEKQHTVSDDAEQSYEELERAYQQNTVDYEDYQREKAIRLEQLNQTLLDLRINLRNNQSAYAVHPIGRDRAYRRYWLFQSLPGLFVEQEDEFVGKCLPAPTPLESRYKKLFGKENPLIPQVNEADLIRAKTCDVACSTDSSEHLSSSKTQTTLTTIKREPKYEEDEGECEHDGQKSNESPEQHNVKLEANNDLDEHENHISSDRLNGDGGADHDLSEPLDILITDEMNYCTGDESTCWIHGKKRPMTPKWWFYHQPEAIDRLVEGLNKRGFRESELQDVLSAENSIIKQKIAECPAYKLNKTILEQSGIRRSRRLRTKGTKRRGRFHDG